MSNISRRDFIKAVGIGAAIITVPGTGLGFNLNDSQKPEIGIQLYTVRNEIEKDFERTIRRIAGMGFKGVETFFFPDNISLAYGAEVIKKYGLKILGSHCELPVGKERKTILKMAETYNTDRMVYHGWPQDEKYKGLDAIKRTTDIYNEINQFANSNGIKFGLHNHWWEFQEVDGITPFYYLLENLDPKIFFEIDVYWTKTAGLDPSKVIKDFGRRAPLLHIKDGPAPKGKPVHKQSVLGKGTINFAEIAKAGEGNTEWMIVEFDEYEGDIFDAVQNSYDYLVSNEFAVGLNHKEKIMRK